MFFHDEKFVLREKNQILHRIGTIKGPMKNPAPHKILEKRVPNLTTSDLAYLSIIYLPRPKWSNFVELPKGNEKKGSQIGVKFDSNLTTLSNLDRSPDAPILSAPDFCLIFFKIWVNFLQTF